MMNLDMFDADMLFDAESEIQWEQMRAFGVPEEFIQQAKKKKQWKEDVSLCSLMIKQRAWETDVSCSFTDCYLRLCAALEGLVRRHEAISRLKTAHEECYQNPKIMLALAKLLFKDDQKDESLSLCLRIFEQYAAQQVDLDDYKSADPNFISEEDAEDAYYLGGWVKIHDDDHTMAYQIWKDGHHALPSSQLLAIQFRKRECWDEAFHGISDEVSHLIGASPHHDTAGEAYSLERDFDSFMCYDAQAGRRRVRFTINGEEVPTYLTPALGIFDRTQAERGVVFRSRQPLLTPEECRNVVDATYRYHEEHCGGVWSTVRHSSVKTTDVAVESIPLLRAWLLALMHTKLNHMLSFLFPVLADGSTMSATPKSDDMSAQSRIRIHDAFIVRYDAEKDLSLSLPEHCDTSAVSVIVPLNSEAEGDYTGGGTWFEALGEQGQVVNAEVGQAVAFAGPLKHAGYPTTQGTRLILVLFLYVEGYHYGPHLSKAKESCVACLDPPGVDKFEALVETAQMPAGGVTAGGDGCPAEEEKSEAEVLVRSSPPPADKLLPSGGEKGGFVVYKQTVDLVNMLEKPLLLVENDE